MAFVAFGFAAGLLARPAIERHAAPVRVEEPRDVYEVTPATEDSPAMVLWVAAELSDTETQRPRTLMLGYRLDESN